jgi:hypothetical protein
MPGQSESGCFSPVQWNPLVQYQEFNHLTLEWNDQRAVNGGSKTITSPVSLMLLYYTWNSIIFVDIVVTVCTFR